MDSARPVPDPPPNRTSSPASPGTARGQRLGGAHRVLSVPWFYRSFQRLLGADNVRSTLVHDYIRPRRGERLLDVGCGPGDLLPLLGETDYTGVDIDAGYVAAARARHGSRGEFSVGDAADLRATGRRFDVVLGLALLHHLDDREAARFLDSAAGALAEGGRFVSLDCAYTDRQNPLARALIALDRGRHVRPPTQYTELLRSRFAAVEIDVRTDLLRIPYTHVIAIASDPLDARPTGGT